MDGEMFHWLDASSHLLSHPIGGLGVFMTIAWEIVNVILCLLRFLLAIDFWLKCCAHTHTHMFFLLYIIVVYIYMRISVCVCVCVAFVHSFICIDTLTQLFNVYSIIYKSIFGIHTSYFRSLPTSLQCEEMVEKVESWVSYSMLC